MSSWFSVGWIGMFSEITRLNQSHQGFRHLARTLGDCSDTDVCSAYRALLRSIEQIFASEQRLMEKHQFPATKCHLEQHARVLCALHCAHSAIMRGDHAMGRRLGAHLLLQWFELHNATMDAALSVWVSCRIQPAMREFSEGCSWRRWPSAINQKENLSQRARDRPYFPGI